MNRAHGALVLATISWGFSLTAADAALDDLTASDLLILETVTGTAVAGLIWLLVSLRTGRSLRSHGGWRPAFILGSLEPGLSYVFANLGLVLTSAAVGSMLFSLESVALVVIAWIVLRNRPRRVETTALGLGVAGTVLVASAESGGQSSVLGIVFMLLSIVSAAVYTFVTQRIAGGLDPFALVTRQGVASLVISSPFVAGSWFIQGSHLGTAPVSILLLAGLSGVLGFTIPMILWAWAAPRVSSGFVAVALNLTPLVGVLGATAFGQGAPGAVQWAGGSLILLGVILLTRAELRAGSTSTVTKDLPPRELALSTRRLRAGQPPPR